MENVLDTIADVMLLIAGFVLLAIVIKTLIPRLLLKVRYDLDRGLGRGCKRYSYPTGRAVVYEPHPSVRKYINKYALFVNEGYKYLKCSVDGCVKTLKFNVIMLNAKNKVIDVVTVNARIGASAQTREILLHPETSYVAIDLEEANGLSVKRLVKSYYTLLQLAGYFAVMAAVCFLALRAVSSTLESVMGAILKGKVSLAAFSSIYFAVALAVAAVALFIAVVSATRKGIEVVIHGKKQSK